MGGEPRLAKLLSPARPPAILSKQMRGPIFVFARSSAQRDEKTSGLVSSPTIRPVRRPAAGLGHLKRASFESAHKPQRLAQARGSSVVVAVAVVGGGAGRGAAPGLTSGPLELFIRAPARQQID